ncbi:ABC transporter permease [Telmatobacter sp. DSM 110680]|uniref:ABC transporter permease n=1 Tax=Telmatobacter sp. DSM 110680 TaxID=3036704 RepID=A0AAU7DNG8_9BACT
MSLWRQLTYGLRGLARRANRSQETDEELRHYFEEATAAWRARGLSAEDAIRAARREFGSTAAIEEQVLSYGWENSVRTFFSDLHFAARQLRNHPGFAVIGILTLALGVGASTAIFSAINPILFKPLPYPNPGRILMIWSTNQGARSEVSFGTYYELAQRSHSFDTIAIFEPWQPTITGGSQPERLEGQSVSAGFFRVLGVSPVVGRDFLASENVFNGPKVVILSDKIWRRLFHSDPAILGRAIKLGDDNYTVVGIMSPDFEDVLAPSDEIWTPTQYDPEKMAGNFNSWEWGNHLRMIGRLNPGLSRTEGKDELTQIARSPWREFPRPRWASLQHGLIVDSLQDDIAHTVKPALLAVLGAVILVLAIAWVNVVNLVLARGSQRRGEFAVRGALGASKRRIIRQLITENLLLASFGGVAGIAVAIVTLRELVALSPAELPRRGAIAIDPATFFFAFAITAIIGIASGLIPAIHISREELQTGLQQNSRRSAGGGTATRRGLVVSEVALAFILLISAGLLLHSMRRLLAVEPGFDSSHLLTMQVVTSGHQFDNPASAPDIGDRTRRRFFEQALDAVRRLPGVEDAAFTSLLPLSDDPPVDALYGAQFEDQGADAGYNVFRYAVSPGYCQTMGIPLLSGRFLDERDTASAPQTALISESMAKSHFGSQNPLGKRLHVGPRDRPWYTVVGVVGDVKQTSLAINQADAVYLATEQTWFADDTLSFVIRARAQPAELAPAIERAIWSIDKNQPVVRVMTMDRMIAVTEAERGFVLILFEAFGIVALVLAAVGIYGLLSGNVTERAREIGVRAALGASRGDILALILRDGMRLTGLGIAVGLCGAIAATRAITTLLFGTSPLDPIAWVAVILMLAGVSAMACWAPAWRASRVDPSITLRAE